MVGNKLTEGRQPQSSVKQNRFQRNIPRAQETIFNYLLEIVKEWSPEEVLAEFKHLFVHHTETVSSSTLPALYEIVFSNQEAEFRNTLKRSCYILINNWDLTRNHKSIQALIQVFSDPAIAKPTMSPTLKRLRIWLKNFLGSQDFQELKLFAAKYEEQDQHWSQRYVSYLLVPQYIDLNNPIEQREAAKALSRKLKEKFKFELAVYTAHSQPSSTQNTNSIAADKLPRNPTLLGDDGLRLIKKIVAKRGVFSHASLANIFVQQTQNLTYEKFKKSLQKYLIFSVENTEFIETLKTQLAEKLDVLYTTHHDRPIDDALLLRTSNRVIEYLTTEDHREPSSLFILLLSQGSPLTLVVVLLKIILICRYARTHLDARIAELIIYYQEFPQEECQWVITFFEIFNITMTIYAENIEYNLVSMDSGNAESSTGKRFDSYRIFSSQRRSDNLEEDSAMQELKSIEEISEDEDVPSSNLEL
jgi:hypothetical protein